MRDFSEHFQHIRLKMVRSLFSTVMTTGYFKFWKRLMKQFSLHNQIVSFLFNFFKIQVYNIFRTTYKFSVFSSNFIYLQHTCCIHWWFTLSNLWYSKSKPTSWELRITISLKLRMWICKKSAWLVNVSMVIWFTFKNVFSDCPYISKHESNQISNLKLNKWHSTCYKMWPRECYNKVCSILKTGSFFWDFY